MRRRKPDLLLVLALILGLGGVVTSYSQNNLAVQKVEPPHHIVLHTPR